MNAPQSANAIGYLADCDTEYAKGLKAVERDRAALTAFVAEWRYLASDAEQALPGPKDWQAWLDGLKGARKDAKLNPITEAWVRRFGAILMPRVLMEVTMIAQHFVAPWGCAFIRCREQKLIQDRDGVAIWTATPPPPDPGGGR
jgi:hypothetical protein